MSEDKTCPNCGAALMPGDVFCGECGVRVRAPDYDVASDVSFEDIPPTAPEEPSAEEPVLAEEPATGEYVAPPPVGQKASDWTALRIVSVVVAVGLLLVSLCLCSFGGFALIPSEDSVFKEDLGFAMALCFAPGVILGLLGIAAAYFGFRKQ
jgi:hypothetical protein